MILRGWLFLALAGIVSCGGKEKEEEAGNVASQPPAQEPGTLAATSAQAAPLKPAGIPPLREYMLKTVTGPIALVKVSGQQDRHGVLLQGGSSRSGRYMNYVMLCEVPEGTDSATVAFSASDGSVAVSAAKRVSTLPSGLSVFGFSSSARARPWRPEEPAEGDTFHAVRVMEGTKLTGDQLAVIQEELSGVRAKIEETERKRQESRFNPSRETARPPRPNSREEAYEMQRQRREQMEAMRTGMMEIPGLRKSEAELELRMKVGIGTLESEEVASFPGRDVAEAGGKKLDGTLLVSSKGGIVAIQSMGEWLDLKKVIDGSGKLIDSAKISLSGGPTDVTVTCELYPVIPSTVGNHILIAETTHGLETVGSGSIEERLAKVPPVPFHGSGNYSKTTKQMKWAGAPTKLWVKVLDPDNPGEPILDEVILLDYPGRFSARWEKEPSAIISIPPAQPDMPEDLVEEKAVLDAKGEILDIVAAGDGSVVMVRTGSEPYWAPLDLKSGKWLPAPWKASANTLLATQAGKVYLFDRESMVVEVWGLGSGKREGLHVLQFQEPAIAVAAPLTDPAQPVMLATANGLHFLDPEDFEPISCGADGGELFADPKRTDSRVKPLDPATVSLRATDDGALYSISGKRVGSSSRTLESVVLTMDRSRLVVKKSTGKGAIGSKGRNQEGDFPDHAGKGVRAAPQAYAARFPESTGEIRFSQGGSNGEAAVLRNPPILPDTTGRSSAAIAQDRSLYLDSANGAMLLPDGDKLHFLRLRLPEAADVADPVFLFSGETFEVPLPPGTGHSLSTREGVQGEITDTHARWIAPEGRGDALHRLKLEWTGELGSAISSEYQIRVINGVRQVMVESTDGSRSFPLHRRGTIPGMPAVTAFAGSGFVALTTQSKPSAWNLASCERIFTIPDTNARGFFGDADQAYVHDYDGKLISFDLHTGNKITEVALGRGVSSVATGMSSRDSLLAIESASFQGYLLQVSRDTLKSRIVDLPEGLRKRFWSKEIAVNASGSAAWAGGVGIFRDGRAITVTPYEGLLGSIAGGGTPDLFGRQIIRGKTIMKLTGKSTQAYEISELPAAGGIPGPGDMTQYSMDASGLYILIRGRDFDSNTQLISVRDIRSPEKELFKIRYPGDSHGTAPVFAAESKTLVNWQMLGNVTCAFVHDLDVREVIAKLSN